MGDGARKMADNKMVVVGGMGSYICFLNVEKEEAIRRYLEYYGLPEDSLKYTTYDFEFGDSFRVYDVAPHVRK